MQKRSRAVVKFLSAIAALLVITVEGSMADTVVQAEIPTAVELSNRDINRIVCPGQMNDLIFSQEKGMTGHFSGGNGFVKFKIEKIGDEVIYADSQSELFVVCNKAVYTLLVTPTDISAVTLRLASPMGDSFKENIAHHKNLPLEKQALQIIREAYQESYPASYRISESNTIIPLSADVEVQLLKVVEVDGVGLRLKQFQIKSIAAEQIRVDEQMFLAAAISGSILAVGIEKHVLEPHQATRLFVVDQKERQE
jgi:conjugal transfer pilus assembly protein TraK